MKKLTQLFFLVSFCFSAFAQQPNTKTHERISNTADLIARLKKDLPQDLQGYRSESVKPACIVDSILTNSASAPSSTFTLNGKQEYGYNAQYNVFIKKRYSRNTFNQSWYYYYKTNLTYDSHDNLLNEASFSASSQGTTTVWNNSGSTNYTYDNNNNQISATYQNWNSQTNTWKTNSINTSTYNANNLITQEIYQSANSFTAPLVNNYKYTYSYDIFNAPLLFQEYIWNTTTNSWENSMKYTIAASGTNITAYTGYEWDSTTNSWINADKGNMTYDANGNQTSQTEQVWNGTTNSWENDYKWTSTYDANHNELSALSQNWNSTTNAWENSNRTLYTYNSANYEVTEIWANWDSSTNAWKNQNETDTYYNCHSVGISEESLSYTTLVIYPNPAESELSIKSDKEFSNIFIVNVNGQLVLKSAANETLNVSLLAKGIYFIQLLDKNKNVLSTQKFVKE